MTDKSGRVRAGLVQRSSAPSAGTVIRRAPAPAPTKRPSMSTSRFVSAGPSLAAAPAAFVQTRATSSSVLQLQTAAGNSATTRLLTAQRAPVQHPTAQRPTIQRDPPTPAPAAGVTAPSPPVPTAAAPSASVLNRVGFVREEGLNLRTGPDQASASLAQLRLGTRVHVLEDESTHAGWKKVTTANATGFLSAPRVHHPPPELIAKDPGLTMVRVRSGQTFWGLVKEQYGIQGNESTADQNMNHFINAIRAVNKSSAFIVETDWLDDIGNSIVSGRDASDTLLKADYDLWIPSFGVAAAMDVGSGTVTGEITRLVKKIEQKIADFKAAGQAAGKYIPAAVTRHCGDAAMGLLTGLIDFALDAAKILIVSTAVGALIGALFGGVGAIPGAEIGFEIGLLILEYYGLAMLIEMILSMAGALVGQLGSFISQVWAAEGDPKKLDNAGKTLADALGIFASALLLALAAYLMKKGADAFAKTKFAGKISTSELGKWMADRQKMRTTADALEGKGQFAPEPGKAGRTTEKNASGAKSGVDATPETIHLGTVRIEEHPNYGTQVAALEEMGFKIVKTPGDPHVVIRQVVGPDGAVLRVEREMHVSPGMRYLDFEHEMGHVRQATDLGRFPDGPRPTEIKVETPNGLRDAPNQAGVLTSRHNAITEYHNRLQELVWLEERGSSNTVMLEHLDGIDGAPGMRGWARKYENATAGGAKSSMAAWGKEHFPDIPALEARVRDIRERLTGKRERR